MACPREVIDGLMDEKASLQESIDIWGGSGSESKTMGSVKGKKKTILKQHPRNWMVNLSSTVWKVWTEQIEPFKEEIDLAMFWISKTDDLERFSLLPSGKTTPLPSQTDKNLPWEDIKRRFLNLTHFKQVFLGPRWVRMIQGLFAYVLPELPPSRISETSSGMIDTGYRPLST